MTDKATQNTTPATKASITSGTRYLNCWIVAKDGSKYKQSIIVKNTDAFDEIFSKSLSAKQKAELNSRLADAVIAEDSSTVEKIKQKLSDTPSKSLDETMLNRFSKKQLVQLFTSINGEIGGMQTSEEQFDDMI